MKTIINWWVSLFLVLGLLLSTGCNKTTLSKDAITAEYPKEYQKRWTIKSFIIDEVDVTDEYASSSIKLFDNGYAEFRQYRIDEAGTWYKDTETGQLVFNFPGTEELNTVWEITKIKNRRMTISKLFPYSNTTMIIKRNK